MLYTNHVIYIYSLNMIFGLHKVVGNTMSNTWLFDIIFACDTSIYMYICYDNKIHLFVQTPISEIYTY